MSVWHWFTAGVFCFCGSFTEFQYPFPRRTKLQTFASTTQTTKQKPANLSARGRDTKENGPVFDTAALSGFVIQRKASCACGGGCPGCKAKSSALKVSQPSDPAEIEADHIADKVMTELADPVVNSAPLRIQRFTGRTGVENAAPASVDQALTDPGKPLELALRQEMEQRFGYDFSRVRVHSGAAAEQSARDVDATAYTVGDHIVFDAGQFAPGTREGRRLIAHELTHVVQQSRADKIRPDQNNTGPSQERPTGNRVARSALSVTAGGGNPILQRDRHRTSARRHRSESTPSLGPCRPVQDDLRPTAPWSVLQRGYQARCSTAATDVAGQIGGAVDDILNLRRPRTPHLPDARSSVDCACAYGTPLQAALAAMPVLLHAGPLAAGLYRHFLGGSGTPMTIDVLDMITRSAGVRRVIRGSMARGRRTGTTHLRQDDYGDRELQFAYGAIDCVQWRALAPARRSWRSDPTTRIQVSMLDYYEFHPGRLGISQCAHAACVELVALGDAKNFWTSGDTVVSWGQLQR